MLSKEDLLAISELMDLKFEQNLAPVNQRLNHIDNRLEKVDQHLEKVDRHLEKVDQRLDRVEQRLDQVETEIVQIKEDIVQIKEDTAINRSQTNSIGEWIDFYFRSNMPYPVGINKDDTDDKNKNAS